MATDSPASAPPAVTRGEVARGAGLAGLSRAGALIEALAQPLYTRFFGIETYGLYVALWGAVSLLVNFIHLSMPVALQRLVPARDEAAAHGAVKLSLIIAVLPATVIAFIITLISQGSTKTGIVEEAFTLCANSRFGAQCGRIPE